jgi:hypothetical protein
VIFESLVESSTDHVVSASNKAITIKIVTDMWNDLCLPFRKQFSLCELLSWTTKSMICALAATMIYSLRTRRSRNIPWGCSHELGVSDVLAGPPGRDALDI